MLYIFNKVPILLLVLCYMWHYFEFQNFIIHTVVLGGQNLSASVSCVASDIEFCVSFLTELYSFLSTQYIKSSVLCYLSCSSYSLN